MKTPKTTLANIAEALDISMISVSRALSGRDGVSDDLRAKIIDTAKKMGYNRCKNSENINILVLHQKPYIQDNSIFSYKVQGIEKAIQNTGAEYSVEFVNNENQDRLILPYKLARGYLFDGIIYIGSFQYKYVEFLRQKFKNAVVFTGIPPCYDFDCVWFNFYNAGYKQCEYLIKKGHKNIGYIGGIGDIKGNQIMTGIYTAFEDYGVTAENKYFVDMKENQKESYQKALALLNRADKPTAFICRHDYDALQLFKYLYEKEIKVPFDVSLIGSGNTEMSSLCNPALTTLDLNIEYSCQATVSLLLNRINNPDKPFENITINCNLVERDSVKAL